MKSRFEVGEKAPSFRLPSNNEEMIGLNDFAGEKSVFIVFYRGNW